jgi:hypothetical protein
MLKDRKKLAFSFGLTASLLLMSIVILSILIPHMGAPNAETALEEPALILQPLSGAPSEIPTDTSVQ